MKLPKTFIPKKDLEEKTQRLLKEKPRKKKEEHGDRLVYEYIEYKGLTLNEFSDCNYPEDKLNKIKVGFEYKSRSFEATHEDINKTSTQINLKVRIKDMEIKLLDRGLLELVLMKYKFYYKPLNTHRKISIYGLGIINNEYRYVIDIPGLLFCKLELVTDIKGFYQKKFKKACVYARYNSISSEEYYYSNLPLYKINTKRRIGDKEKTFIQ